MRSGVLANWPVVWLFDRSDGDRSSGPCYTRYVSNSLRDPSESGERSLDRTDGRMDRSTDQATDRSTDHSDDLVVAEAIRSSEPPVVARLVVEIRSDGRRTIARGAMEDVSSGQRVAVEAHGNSPGQLAWALARSVFSAPILAGKTIRALLPGRRGRR